MVNLEIDHPEMNNSSDKVIVGMSGGVDSSIAAHLLVQEGYDVEGLFMKNWEEDDGSEYCTAQQDLEDAEKVCNHLGIKLNIANFSAEYWENVFELFLRDYQMGRTPNPDILCNREIKFQQFLKYAETLGANKIATGHYVSKVEDAAGIHFCKALDTSKDQTYFLQAVPRDRLERCIFPLGGLLKTTVRSLAKQLKLGNDNKKDSTGICFIGERRFSDFISRYIPNEKGLIKDTEGRTLGEHLGLHFYTLGQRQGLKIGGVSNRPELPWYVAEKKLETNELVATQNEDCLKSKWLIANDVNWLEEINFPVSLSAKIRYRQKDQKCTIRPCCNKKISVEFEAAQTAITPGQYVAFYDEKTLMGGGYIEGSGPSLSNSALSDKLLER